MLNARYKKKSLEEFWFHKKSIDVMAFKHVQKKYSRLFVDKFEGFFKDI